MLNKTFVLAIYHKNTIRLKDFFGGNQGQTYNIMIIIHIFECFIKMKHEKLIFVLKQKKNPLEKSFFSGCIKIYSLFHVVYFSSFFKFMMMKNVFRLKL